MKRIIWLVLGLMLLATTACAAPADKTTPVEEKPGQDALAETYTGKCGLAAPMEGLYWGMSTEGVLAVLGLDASALSTDDAGRTVLKLDSGTMYGQPVQDVMLTFQGFYASAAGDGSALQGLFEIYAGKVEADISAQLTAALGDHTKEKIDGGWQDDTGLAENPEGMEWRSSVTAADLWDTDMQALYTGIVTAKGLEAKDLSTSAACLVTWEKSDAGNTLLAGAGNVQLAVNLALLCQG